MLKKGHIYLFIFQKVVSKTMRNKIMIKKGHISRYTHAWMLKFCEHGYHNIMNQCGVQGLLYIPKEVDIKIWIFETTSSEIQQAET
jgi:hypothetical protein